MPKIKYDVSGSDPEAAIKGRGDSPKPGMYVAKVKTVEAVFARDKATGKPDKDRPQLQIIFEVKKADKSKNQKYKGAQLYFYLPTPANETFENQVWKVDQFLQAIGLASKKKRKATLDTDDLIGKIVVLQVRSGKNLEGDYRGEIGRVLAYDKESFGQATEDEDDSDDSEETDDDELEDFDDEDSDEDADEDEEDEESPDYSEMSLKDLRAEAKERDIDTAGMKKADLIEALEESDNEDEDEEDEDSGDEDEEEGPDLEALGEAGDEDDKKAQKELTKLAKAAGIDPDEYETWPELAEALAESDEEDEEEPPAKAKKSSAKKATSKAKTKAKPKTSAKGGKKKRGKKGDDDFPFD